MNFKKIDKLLNYIQSKVYTKEKYILTEEDKEKITNVFNNLVAFEDEQSKGVVYYFNSFVIKKSLIENKTIYYTLNNWCGSKEVDFNIGQNSAHKKDSYYYDDTYYKDFEKLKQREATSISNGDIVIEKSKQQIMDEKYSIESFLSDCKFKYDQTFYDIKGSFGSLFMEKLNLTEKYMEKIEEQLIKLPIVTSSYSFKLYTILRVFEVKNKGTTTRFALIVGPYKSYRYADAEIRYQIIKANPNHDFYNYLDQDRYIALNNPNFIAFDILTDKSNFDLYWKNYITFLNKDENREQYRNQYISNPYILTNITKQILEEKKKFREQQIANIKNLKYKEAIEKISDTEYFEKNEIKFYKHRMVYENIEFDSNEVIDFPEYLKQKTIDEITDFNDILNNSLVSIGNYFVLKNMTYDQKKGLIEKKAFPISRIFINKPSFSFSVDGKQITLIKKNGFCYVNGIRINKNEVGQVLTHILCHKDLESYHKFLEIVSKCSIKFHTAIGNGLQKSFGYGAKATTVELKIKREKNRNYLVLGKQNYSITDTNRLINSKVYDMQELIFLLLETVDITIDKTDTLITEAEKRYKTALEKSKKFLANTIKTLGVTIETHEDKEGYVIKGKSGKKYFIVDGTGGAHTNGIKVWEIKPNGVLDYRCIVDKTSKGHMGKDAIVSRLYALANDTLIAESVYTLKV